MTAGKKFFRIGFFAVVLAVLYLSCDNNPKKADQHTGPYEVGDVAGTWGVDLMPSLFLNLKIFVRINFDTTYGIYAAADSTRLIDSVTFTDTLKFVDTVFIHEGRWSLGGEYVQMAGTHCEKPDDTLHTIVPYDCGKPVTVKIVISNNVWSVNVEDFKAVAASIGIDFPPGVFGVLPLTRQ